MQSLVIFYSADSVMGFFYLSSLEGTARPFHQLTLPCDISLSDGPDSVIGCLFAFIRGHPHISSCSGWADGLSPSGGGDSGAAEDS